jgi:ABC-type uncharacterized transport system involved in gliding motility auxiliary subunit
MKRVGFAAGVTAIVALVLALDAAVLTKTLFHWTVLALAGLCLVSGLAWTVLFLAGLWTPGKTPRAHGKANAVVGSIVFFFICAVLYALVQQWDREWDLTREGRRQLSEQTVQVLKNLDRDTTVTAFFVVTGDSFADAVREKTRRFLDRVQQHTDRLSVEFVDPQRHPERLQALALSEMPPAGLVVLTSGTRQRTIPLSDVTSRLEERDFTNALINVVRDSEPNICFLTGHGEVRLTNQEGTKGGARLGIALQRESYRVQETAIPLSNPQVAAECDVLVIFGPQSDLYPQELQAIEAFLARGGRLLIMLDPAYVLPGQDSTDEQFRPWLQQRLGVQVGSDAIVSAATQSLETLLVTDFSLVGATGDDAGPGTDSFRGSFSAAHPITRGLDSQMVLSAARTVELTERRPEGVVLAPLLRTTPDTWAERNLELLYKEGKTVEDADERGGPLTVAVAVTLEAPEAPDRRDARVVVIGDADFATNEKMTYVGHSNFLLNTAAWLTENEDLIAIRPTGEEGEPIKLSPRQQQAIGWAATLGPLHLIILAGIVVYMRRRKHA